MAECHTLEVVSSDWCYYAESENSVTGSNCAEMDEDLRRSVSAVSSRAVGRNEPQTHGFVLDTLVVAVLAVIVVVDECTGFAVNFVVDMQVPTRSSGQSG